MFTDGALRIFTASSLVVLLSGKHVSRASKLPTNPEEASVLGESGTYRILSKSRLSKVKTWLCWLRAASTSVSFSQASRTRNLRCSSAISCSIGFLWLRNIRPWPWNRLIRCLGYYLDDLWWALKSLDTSWCILLGGFHRFHPRKHDKLYIPDAQNRLSFHSHRSRVENPCWSNDLKKATFVKGMAMNLKLLIYCRCIPISYFRMGCLFTSPSTRESDKTTRFIATFCRLSSSFFFLNMA